MKIIEEENYKMKNVLILGAGGTIAGDVIDSSVFGFGGQKPARCR